MLKLIKQPTKLALLGLPVVLMASCMGDPFPEPDPNGGDESPDDSAADAGADDFDDDVSPPMASLIHTSAPNTATGVVAVVGLAGCAPGADEIEIRFGNHRAFAPVFEDGSFAARITAGPAQAVSFAAVQANARVSAPVTVLTGVATGAPVGDGIWGTGQIVPTSNGLVYAIGGNGSRLVEGALVIGGNVTRSTGGHAIVTGRQFELLLTAQPGDKIDLFLVYPTTPAGFTDTQTITVP